MQEDRAIRTQRSGETHTSAVQMSISTGKESIVAVRPKFSMTKPVPNSEKAKEIELVTCTAQSQVPAVTRPQWGRQGGEVVCVAGRRT